MLVGLVADACERGEFIALRSRRQDDELLGRELAHVFHLDDGFIAVLDEAELAGDLDVGAHRSAVDDDLLRIQFRELHDADEALEVRCEHRDDEASLRFGDDLLEGRIDDRFGDRESRLPDVGRVHEEREHLAILEDPEFALLLCGRDAVLVVELDVAREDDVSPLRFDDDAHGIRHGVRDAEESDGVVAELDDLVLLDFPYLDRRRLREFLLAFLDHHARETAGVDHRIPDAIDDVGDAADMVEVAVRDEKPADLVAALFEIAGIGKHIVDAGRIVLRAEAEAAVEDEDIVADLDRSHVAADLFDAAQGHDAHGISRKGRDRGLRALALAGRCGMLDAHA